MKNRKLPLFIISILMTTYFLAGCGNSKEEPLPVMEETSSSASEIKEVESGAQFSFSDVSELEFWFGSGVGAWSTVLTVDGDGSFEGEYHDFDMGDIGEDYPYGVCYLSNFTGKFTEPVKINDYTYSVKLQDMELKEEPDTEEIIDGIRYIYSAPHGLEDAKEVLFYLPGAPIQDLPTEYRNWMTGYGTFTDTQLPFYGLYNVNTGGGFSSYEKSPLPSVNDELVNISEEAQALENKLETEALSQVEMNITASEIYQLWDDELNVIWNQLKEKLNLEAMEALTAEEREWITFKENEIQKAGAEFEGGSMQPMVESLKGAELTKARVYELAEYLQ